MRLPELPGSHGYCLAAGVRLRQENFGGIVFLKTNGTVIDIDREAFVLLGAIQDSGMIMREELLGYLSRAGINVFERRISKVLGQMAALGILEECGLKTAEDHRSVSTTPVNNSLSARCLSRYRLCAPETVHWAVTLRCEADCPDCYAARYRNWSYRELDPAEALRVVDKIAEWGVLQLALGGGEPLLRPDICDIASRASGNSLVVHITTGFNELDCDTLKKLSGSIATMQFGIKHERLLAQPAAEIGKLKRVVTALGESGIGTGANLILSNSLIRHFDRVIEYLVQCGFLKITLLRYKPPASEARWAIENPAKDALLEFETVLSRIVARYPDVFFRVDCALSFLQRRLDPREALFAGIRGCVAASRIVALSPDGSVFPCSQLIHPRCRLGDIMEDDCAELWNRAKTQVYHSFRNRRSFRRSACGICRAQEQCGGCRVFAADGMGADPGCPGPVFLPPEQLGKEGRTVDLRHYIQLTGSISVGGYMARYGVGQKRAVSELKNSPLVLRKSDPEATGRKKSDVYETIEEDLLTGIQEMIGFTSGGAPFATLEQIAARLKDESADLTGEPADRAYPKWLLNPSREG